MFGKRILILIPHPDDEVVGFAASVARAQQEGAAVYGLYLTHGCIARDVRWSWDRKNHEAHVILRQAEAEEAAKFLGITPVLWSERAARQLWRDLPAVNAEIEQALCTYQIDQIWVPAYEGGNADHDAANAVASVFAKQVSVLEFAEYNYADGKTQAQAFPFPNDTEVVIKLSPQESAQKKLALEIYQSEQGNLFYVGCARETYRPLAPYDYAKPPHSGKLWYERFQWVPFRHPRVDFTQSAEVSEAIMDFLGERN